MASKRKIILLTCSLVIFLIIGLGALLITFWRSPLQIQIRSDLNNTDMFAWGDHISLTAHLSSGIEFFVSWSWSLIPLLNSTHSVVHRSGATLEFHAVDELYFNVAICQVRVAYLGILFAVEANYTLNSYRVHNDSYFINTSAIVSWNVATQLLVLRRSLLPVPALEIGDKLIHMDGLFLVNISRIIQIDAATYTLLVSNISIADAFVSFTADGDLILTSQNENLREREFHVSDTEISFNPFPSTHDRKTFTFSPEFSFTIEQGSEISAGCTVPAIATHLSYGDLISQSFRLTCRFKFAVTADIDIESPLSGEYTYYLFDDDDDVTNGLQPIGKLFSFKWMALAEKLSGIFKPKIELRIPLRYKVEIATEAHVNIYTNYEADYIFDFIYTQNGGWTIDRIPPIPWNMDTVEVAYNGQEKCDAHIDLAIGLALSLEFFAGITELSAEFLVHLPWYDAWTLGYNDTAHGIHFNTSCDIGYIPETIVVGLSAGIEIGLSFWKWGISKSKSYDFAPTLLSEFCVDADCGRPYRRYTCEYAMFQPPKCFEYVHGEYQGIAACKADCEQSCTTCDNPACCFCPGREGPCTGACSFACPGDKQACCGT